MSDMLELDQIVPMIEKIKFTIIQMEQKLTKMAEEINQKEQQLVDREKELETQSQTSEKLKAQYEAVEQELARISSLYSEASGKQEDISHVKEILSIYITLLEKVFEGKPHAKILFLLHGEKNTMTREELKMSTGFTPAVVLRSIHELRNAELIDFDEEKDSITLKARIYE
ncbi:MAG: hypothetical protein ACFFD4_26425 [Candidatus Odinarchaeota archaeon]